jgi:hypothetical protein
MLSVYLPTVERDHTSSFLFTSVLINFSIGTSVSARAGALHCDTYKWHKCQSAKENNIFNNLQKKKSDSKLSVLLHKKFVFMKMSIAASQRIGETYPLNLGRRLMGHLVLFGADFQCFQPSTGQVSQELETRDSPFNHKLKHDPVLQLDSKNWRA